ncbi:MAG: ERCC4 domain-containing protein [archaeon]
MNAEMFNIFERKNKKSIKEQPKEKVVVDYREKNCLVPSSLIRLGLEIEFTELKTGDYLVKDIIIERKTVSDFLSSMLNKRLSNQLNKMNEYENKLLIIEGISEQELYSDSNPHKRINANAIRGFLLSILLKHKIPILFTKDQEDTARMISILSKRKEKEISMKEKRKGNNSKEQKQLITEGFPGIGPKTAKKILEEFKSIKGFVNATEQDLKKILGKKSETVKKIIEEEY